MTFYEFALRMMAEHPFLSFCIICSAPWCVVAIVGCIVGVFEAFFKMFHAQQIVVKRDAVYEPPDDEMRRHYGE